MARATGMASGKWFGSPAIGRSTVIIGSTAITNVANIGGIIVTIAFVKTCGSKSAVNKIATRK